MSLGHLYDTLSGDEDDPLRLFADDPMSLFEESGALDWWKAGRGGVTQ
jgi:hypothetical protein